MKFSLPSVTSTLGGVLSHKGRFDMHFRWASISVGNCISFTCANINKNSVIYAVSNVANSRRYINTDTKTIDMNEHTVSQELVKKMQQRETETETQDKVETETETQFKAETETDVKTETEIKTLPHEHTPVLDEASVPSVEEFQAETRRLLHLVTHSLYTDKEVFIRELVSNASDALEKHRFNMQSTVESTANSITDEELAIYISMNDAEKSITIYDNGVGMSRNDLSSNLGIIAKSGSSSFVDELNHKLAEKNSNEKSDMKSETKPDEKSETSNPLDAAKSIIGKFGVGFYSSFVVSDSVEVYSRIRDSSGIQLGSGYMWKSGGTGSFTVQACGNLPYGTQIKCYLKDSCLDFLQLAQVERLLVKYSAYLKFPLYVKDQNEYRRVNVSRRSGLDRGASPEEHTAFFQSLPGVGSYTKPMYTIQYHADAPLSIKSVFYVAENAPSRLFASPVNSSSNNVALYSKGVLVSNSSEKILPKWMFFVKGVIDCEDVSLNVSRESMQDFSLMKKLSTSVVRRILKFLQDESKCGETYAKFYAAHNYYLKEGLLEDVQGEGAFKSQILELLRFESSESAEGVLMSLAEYVERSGEKAESIFYYCCSKRSTALISPYIERFLKSKIDVLLMYDDIDEFVAMNAGTFRGKKLVAIDSTDEEFGQAFHEELKKTQDTGSNQAFQLSEEEKQTLQAFFMDKLASKVSGIKFTNTIEAAPAIVTGFLSSTMRKMMKATMRGAHEAQLNLASMPCTLELNEKHQMLKELVSLSKKHPHTAQLIAQQIYDNACLAAGITDDPRSMVVRLNNLLTKTTSLADNFYTHSLDNDTVYNHVIDNDNDKDKDAEKI